MELQHEDAADLIDGISRDVDRRVAELETEAETYAQSRLDAIRTQAQDILRKAEETAQAQCAAIAHNAESRAAVERRKAALRIRDEVIQDTLDRARRIVEESLAKPGYARALKDWIVEAAVGLSVPEASVNASREELPLITAELLRKAEEEAEGLTGKPVRLRKVEDDPLAAQGITLTAEGGRLAYNNQVPTRFLRARTEIRKRVHAVLFNEGN